MIQNENELAVTRERIARVERLLEALGRSARPEEWPAMSSGYRIEIERMQGEILDFLTLQSPRQPENGAGASMAVREP